MKPAKVAPTAKLPLLMYVYGEPHGQTVRDAWPGRTGLWHWMLAQQGFVVASADNRGTNVPRGREWRKSVHRKIGIIAPTEQAAAVRELLLARERAAMNAEDLRSCVAQRHFTASQLVPRAPALTWEAAFAQHHNDLLLAHDAMRDALRAVKQARLCLDTARHRVQVTPARRTARGELQAAPARNTGG